MSFDDGKKKYLLQLKTKIRNKQKSSTQGDGSRSTEITAHPEERFDPFPLTDIQESFLTGKHIGKMSDHVGCHIYCELTTDELDMTRLNQTWENLVNCHDMLRATVLSDGRQQVSREVPPCTIKVYDLKGKSSTEVSLYLQNIRERMSHKVYQAGDLPLFEICVTKLGKNLDIIHFSIDEWIVDYASIALLLRQWRQLYENPGTKLPAPEISFRDYVLTAKQLGNSPQSRDDLSYWTDKLHSLSPDFSLLIGKTAGRPAGRSCFERKRLSNTLGKKDWGMLRNKAAELGATPACLLLSVFSELVAEYVKQDFPIILTFFNRLPLHPSIDDVVGPFISTSIFVAENSRAMTLEQYVEHCQKQLWNDLDHVSVSGVRVLRELKAKNKFQGSLPIVFTSTIGIDREDERSWYDNISYMITQTPQVSLDHQISERNSELHLSWDVVEEYFPPGLIRRMFSDYCHILRTLCPDREIWKSKSVIKKILAASKCEPVKRRILNMSERLSLLADPAVRYEEFPLSEQQQAYLVGQTGLLQHGGTGCLMYQEFEAENLDTGRLNRAWLRLTDIHDMLRAVILPHGAQKISGEMPKHEIEVADWREKSTDDISKELSDTRLRMTRKMFPPGKQPLFELSVSLTDNLKARIHLCISLLIADANSVRLLLSQLFYLYENPEADLAAPEVSFRDYILSLDAYNRSPASEESKEYWAAKLANLPSGAPIPIRDTGTVTVSERQRFENALSGWKTIKEKAETLGIEPGTVLLTAYAEVLSAWTGPDPFTIVVVNWDRLPVHPGISQVVGEFTALSWLVVEKSDLSFSEKALRNNGIVQEDLAHSAVSGLKVIRKISVKRKSFLTFPVVFTNLASHADFTMPSGIKSGYGLSSTPQVLLDNVSTEAGNILYLHWDAVKDAFPAGVAGKMFAGYLHVLELLAEDPEAWDMHDLSGVIRAESGSPGPSQKGNISVEMRKSGPPPSEWNDTKVEYPADRRLHEYIEDQVGRSPDRPALIFEGESLSFRDLNMRANRLAHYLRKCGLGPDRVAGIMLERSLEMVIGLLAILKGGGAYLPIDPSYPEDRINFMLEDSEAVVLLTFERFKDLAPEFKGVKLCLDAESDIIDSQPGGNPGSPGKPDDLAYVIYTSGSTGKPKGCMLSHSAICNRLFWMQNAYQLDENDRVLQKTPFTFDVSVWEFFWPPLAGATLVVAKPGGHRDSRYLVEFIKEHRITTCHFVPSMLSFFLSDPKVGECTSLRQVFTSGEALPYALVEKFFEKLGAKLHNLYGPTEAAVDVTFWECRIMPDKKVPIGKPIANTQMHILDKDLGIVDIGELGELHIGGVNLARGYLNRPDLTCEKFIENPFEPGTKLYKTGDLAKYLPDGNIEYIGRVDFQVKLRGFRIELGEIESILSDHPSVREAAVMVRDQDTPDPKLVAYLVMEDNPPGSKEIRNFVKSKLPDYMVPNIIVPLEAIPVTLHGKLDRKALPWPVKLTAKGVQRIKKDIRETETGDTAKDAPSREPLGSSQPAELPGPETATKTLKHAKEDIKEIVKKITPFFNAVLNMEDIGLADNLFDIGATSLSLVNITQKIEESENIIIPVEVFLENPSLKGVAEYIQEMLPGETEETMKDVPGPAGELPDFPGLTKQPEPAEQDSSFPETQDIPAQDEFSAEFQDRKTLPATCKPVSETAGPPERRDMAIIGISGRFPGAQDLTQFWRNLEAGKRSITRVQRWEPDLYYDKDSANPGIYSEWGGFLENADQFDSLLFKISPAEAKAIDPQERLFMEVAWECLENAGYTARRLNQSAEKTGVFVGAMWNDYQSVGVDHWQKGRAEAVSLHSSVANRVSYFFDLKGPSIATDTSCSAAITAIHLACESIRRGECGAAIAGGVNLLLHPYHYGILCGLDLLSKDEKCGAFSALSTGWIPGEGIGAVLIRPLDHALENRDHIHAVIRGTSVSHTGKSKRYGMSDPETQARSLSELLKSTQIPAESISYIECAAPGAGIADASEITALTRVFKEHGVSKTGSCGLGSLAPNIGHLESASGMAQLAKVLLQMRHKKVPPSIDCEPVSPLIRLKGSPFYIAKKSGHWNNPLKQKGGSYPLRAIVNTLGATGSYAHLIIEEYASQVKKQVTEEKEEPAVLVLSAATEHQLERYAKRFYEFLVHADAPRIRDMAYTMQKGRAEMESRLAIVAHGTSDLAEKLRFFMEKISVRQVFSGKAEKNTDPVPITTDLMLIAEKWVKGAKIEWDPYHDSRARKIPLPSYPFAKETHEVQKKKTEKNLHELQSQAPDLPTVYDAGRDSQGSESQSQAPDLPTVQPVHDKSLADSVEKYIKKMFSEQAELPVDKIDAKKPLEDYGINSILIARLNAALEEEGFTRLPKTIFFEFRTLQDFADYLLNNYRSKFTDMPKCPEISPARGTKVPALTCSLSEPVKPAIQQHTGEIAVTGLAGRYPMASDTLEYWNNLKKGKDCITEIPEDRWNWREYYDPDPASVGRISSKWGGFIDDADKFDPLFFSISPREAELIDPQERIFLETAWKTMEDAGYTRESLRSEFNGKVGVFAGVMYGEYQLYNTKPGSVPLRSVYGSVANRVSYFLNLNGPSMAVDTLCSSSLTCLHIAIESIRRGECKAAIVGGVSLSIHPNKYRIQAQLNMPSSDGRCRSFGDGGDGFVPGEGVGAVFLKPLEKAVADGDHIYGVIKGSSVNHDGKTIGYTVPDPNAQADLILKALENSGTDPRSVSYIEAHGTGTTLGDPIEISGLAKAFGKYTEDKQYCSIGSSKSNIGHLEAAAGIAGLTKVLLQMEHRQLVPSVHSEKLNPNINFEETPFYVQHELAEWKQPVVQKGSVTETFPRRAGISSFGAGGANAHIILEEYEKQGTGAQGTESVPDVSYPGNPMIFVLSAKNEDILKAYALNMKDFLEKKISSESSLALGISLADVVRTAQTGREAMEHRLAVVVSEIKELVEKLEQYHQGEKDIDNLYTGNVKTGRTGSEFLLEGREGAEFVKIIIQDQKFAKLARLWVSGMETDWRLLYKDGGPKRISLPTYPFEKERYWAPDSLSGDQEAGGRRQEAEGYAVKLHPLLHQNTSDFSEQRFSSIFDGREFFLADHVVNGERVLPGVAYLEMARAAVEKAAGVSEDGHTGIRLRNVVWARPVVVGDEPAQLHIGLFPEENGEIAYEIYSAPEDADAELTMHSQGSALLSPVPEVPILDIGALKSECGERILSSGQCYEIFRAMGIDFGPGHRGIEKLYAGPGQVLAKLSLPSSVSDTQDQFVLHPSLTDSALQASIGLMQSDADADNAAGFKPALPFALEELEIFGRCTQKMWASVRENDSKVQKLDIDLCDETGMICMRMKGFSSRVLEGELRTEPPAGPFVGTVMLVPAWDTVQLERGQLFPAPADRVLIVGGTEESRNAVRQLCPKARVSEIQPGDTEDAMAEKLEASGFADHIIWIAPHDSSDSVTDDMLIENQNQGVISVFRMIRALLGMGYGSRVLGWTIVTFRAQPVHEADPANPAHASVHGLIGSMAKEYPNWKIRLADLEADCDPPFADIFTLPADPRGNALVCRDRRWHRQQLIPVRQFGSDRKLYRPGGVYVVIGGAGGIGEAWTEYMIRNYRAQIIWIGRRQKDTVIQAKLDSLAALGQSPLYISADATDRKSMQQAHDEIRKRYSQVNGVIHSAIILSDQSLANMKEEQFRAALSAKADVSVRIAQIFQKESPDFVMFFSSMQTFEKAPGQSNYAAGCTFKDAFAHRLSQEWSCAVKVMNWGYWGSAGIVASDAYRERMALAGVGSLEPPEAMEALEKLLAGPLDRIALLKTTKPVVMEELSQEESIAFCPGNLPSVVRTVRNRFSADPGYEKTSETKTVGTSLSDKVLDALIQTASELIRVMPADIDPDSGLPECGFDPIRLTEFANVLSREYSLELTSAIFFEHPTLRSFAAYLVEKHKDPFVKLFPQISQVRPAKSEEVPHMQEHMQEMDKLLSEILWGQLRSMGLFTEKNSTIADLKAESGIVGLYDRWLEESMAVLVQNNRLRYDGESFSATDNAPADTDAAWQEWDRQRDTWSEYPGMRAQLALAEATTRALPGILTGKVPATDIMFPNSSMELVEGIYKNNPVADYFNESLADTVAACVQELIRQDAAARIRILEIGAGTGGTSVAVFRKLETCHEHIGEYCYTDISKAFLMHAEKEYGEKNPWLTCRIFDVEKPVSGQGTDEGGYDIVIAANVLHATKNIRQTLRNAKAALKDNGLIFLNEISSNTLFAHLTFGLLEGWWLYEDPELRIRGCPGLAPETWRTVLESEGFRSVFFPAREAHDSGMQIIVAESDGVVRQPRVQQVVPPVGKKAGTNVFREQARKSVTITPEKISRQNVLQEKGTAYIKKLLSETLKIPSHKIDSSAPLEKYGMDSILSVQLTDVLRKSFDNISGTIFFEYQTIDALTEHLMTTQKDSLAALVGMEDREDAEKIYGDFTNVTVPAKSTAGSRRRPRFASLSIGPGKEKAGSATDIAIIGLSGRYPHAENIETFWKNLKQGTDCITEIPKDRWDHSIYFDKTANKPGKTCCKWGGFLDDVYQFDPLFFNISPREAEIMDPKERLFLETVWNLLESAGYTREAIQHRYQGRVGVYAGAMYQQYHAFDTDIMKESVISLSGFSAIANRVSYFFNFQGPSVAVDTMCSSATVSIHHACESLIKGDCRMAIAGGVNLTIHPKKYIGLSQAQMLGSHADSRSFGDGDGYLPCEGVGAVLLKPLSEAVRDQDTVFAVIKSTATNHGGHSNGFTVPNPNAQAQLIEDNFVKSGTDPRTIGYVEAAANGSALGDPIEITALNKAFRKFTTDRQFCAIGSVKSNIGHPEAVSGMAQVTKVILQMRHRQLVPSIKAEPLNPHLSFDDTPFYLQQELTDWQRPVITVSGEKREFPRRATVSSFGAGGSNAHLILEEYVHKETKDRNSSARTGTRSDTPQIAVFSAKSPGRLHAVVRQMLEFSENQTEYSLSDITYTLQTGREAMEYRAAMVVNNTEELTLALKTCLKSVEENKEPAASMPIFTGNSEEDNSGIKSLLSGKAGDAVVQVLLAEKNFEKLASYWTKGGKVPWELLREGEEVRRIISLPTYPFEKRRCWIAPGPVSESVAEPILEEGRSPDNIQNAVETAGASSSDRIIDIVSGLTGLALSEINPGTPLEQYGFSSILLTQLLQQIQAQIDPSVSLERINEYRTIQDIINDVLPSADTGEPAPSVVKTGISATTALRRFPELIRLSEVSEGRPVFWFHGGLGDVAIYQVIARKTQRPFYGIQPKGFMTERVPLHGIQAIAAYYLHIIQSVQPEGPYDLGGFCLGGVLAYEVMRQLQESGQVVGTIVMLDSMITAEFEEVTFSRKALMLNSVNMTLFSSILQEPEKIPQTLIPRKDVDTNLEHDLFLQELIAMAIKRGLTLDATQMDTRIRRSVKVQMAYEMDRFSVFPLSDPQSVVCYYFRNKNRLFLGELEPYFSFGTKRSLDHINYWEEWERQLPDLHIMDVDMSNHMMMLSEPKAYETICEFCETLYSGKRISSAFLQSFKKKTQEKHGSMPGNLQCPQVADTPISSQQGEPSENL